MDEWQMCVITWPDKTVKDKNCNEPKKFLCQFDPCNASRKCSDGSAQSKPPDGYVYVGPTGKYYRPYATTKWFLGALKECQNEGATFIEFRTPEERRVLNHMQSE